jgi:hypothetical protein
MTEEHQTSALNVWNVGGQKQVKARLLFRYIQIISLRIEPLNFHFFL